ncbi:MAG: MobA/MobL family protein [Oscillospiraceae bacterium]
MVHTEILLPDHAPPSFTDRAALWNAVEKIEKAKNAQLAREIEIALPARTDEGAEHFPCPRICKAAFCRMRECAPIFAYTTQSGGNPTPMSC